MLVLESPRLMLRHFEPGDLEPLAALYSDPDIRRYYPDGVRTLEETREELEWFRSGHPERPELGLWATIYKPTARLIGRCGLLPWTLDGVDEVEVAYLIDKRLWGQGLATEAAGAIASHAHARLGLPRLVCLILPGNGASCRVAEKIGMRYERALGPEHAHAALYSRPAAAPYAAAPREERVDVFFYGLFMDEHVLAAQGIQATKPRRAYAEGLRLRIGQRATLVREGGARAHGMVYALTRVELERLYAQPGLEAYRAEPIEVRVFDGSTLTAMCYNLGAAPELEEANTEYAARLRDVLTRLGFPHEWT